MKNIMKKSLAGIKSGRAALVSLLLMLLASASFAATDFSTLTNGVEADITSVGTVLMGIGASLIGLALIVCVYRLIKGAIRGG
jgi:NADH:ubiquinone oxidoreductase subunit K